MENVHGSNNVKVPDNTGTKTANQTHPRRSCGTLNPPCNMCGSLSAYIPDWGRSAAMCSCACIIIPDHRSVQHLHVVTSNGSDVKLHYLALCQKPLSSLPGWWFFSLLVPPSTASGGQEKWSYGLLMNAHSSPPAHIIMPRHWHKPLLVPWSIVWWQTCFKPNCTLSQ